MKNMVEDRFDDIGAAITNSGGEIELDLMGKQKSAIPNEAGSSQAPLLLSETGFDGNLDANSLPWPTDNEEGEISDVEDLGSRQFSQFPAPGPTSSSSNKSAQRSSVSTFSSHPNGGLRKKPAVLD